MYSYYMQAYCLLQALGGMHSPALSVSESQNTVLCKCAKSSVLANELGAIMMVAGVMHAC